MFALRLVSTATAQLVPTMMLVLTSALPLTSHAQAGAACDPALHTSAAINACAIQRFQHADSALNVHYTDVMQALAAPARPALRKDQSAWLRQRQRHCKAQHAANEGQPDWPQRLYDCLLQATEARRSALQHWLHHSAPPD